jgi:protein-tyrosine phosphatase
MRKQEQIRVIFVCLGNICRSPMADGVFQQLVRQAGLADVIAVDSAGTAGYHAGERAHRGTLAVLQAHGVPYDGRSRQVARADMAPENWVIAMDEQNMADLRRQFGNHPRLYRLLDFATHHTAVGNVPDPYYTGNFEYVYELVLDGSRGLLARLREELGE